MENKSNTALSGRNYGIDLLRIAAMMMVVMIHVINQGGALTSAGIGNVNYKIAWCMRVFIYGAVNCYAMISGYVGMNAKHKYTSIILLYLQVLFYTVLTTAVFYFFKPEVLTAGSFVDAFLPVSRESYWYFTAYFGMFFFTPFFNKLLHSLSKKDAKVLALTVIILFSVFPAVFRKDIFKLIGGYSVLWLSALYLLGGCIKIIEPEKKIKKRYAILIYVGFSCLTILSAMIKSINPETFLFTYTSPTILSASAGLVIFFSQLKFGNFCKRLITFFAPLAFGVYLVHTAPLVWNNLLIGGFSNFGNASPLVYTLLLIGRTLAVWLLCSAVDYVRLLIFKLLHLKQLFTWLENKFKPDADVNVSALREIDKS